MSKAIIAILLFLFANYSLGDDFLSKLEERGKIYSTLDSKSNRALYFNGDHEKAIRELTEIVEDKNVLDYLILGNMLYRMDPERSFAYHQKAYRLKPDQWLVKLEMAMEFHRRGQCKDALPLYIEIDNQNRLAAPKQALLAHCYLQEKNYPSAISHWNKANYRNNHNSIDFAIFEIFGNSDPTFKFSRLIERIQNGDKTAVEPAIELAVEWRKDWWNAKFNETAYSAIKASLKYHFTKRTDLVKEMELYGLIKSEKNSQKIRLELERGSYIVGNNRLPTSSFLNYRILTIVLQNNVMSAKQILEIFGKELQRRVDGFGQDLYALKMQAFLFSQLKMGDELAVVDKKGWKVFSSSQFASSYLVGVAIQAGDWPKPTDDIYEKLYQDFPNEPFALYYQFTSSQKNNSNKTETIQILEKLINAEYHGLKSSRPRFSEHLNLFYNELEKAIN